MPPGHSPKVTIFVAVIIFPDDLLRIAVVREHCCADCIPDLRSLRRRKGSVRLRDHKRAFLVPARPRRLVMHSFPDAMERTHGDAHMFPTLVLVASSPHRAAAASGWRR